MNLTNTISNIPVFGEICQSTKEIIVNLATTRRLKKREWLAYNGEVWPYLFLVETGEICATKESSEGRSLIAARFSPGDLFWGLAFFIADAATPAALVASANSKIYTWSRDQLMPIILKNGGMSWELTTLMVQRMLLASDIVDGLAFQPVTSRLASFMIRQFGEQPGERVSRDLTLDEMAAHIGTTREMVCRLLHKFSSQGYIDITRTEFIFTDRDGLRKLAQTDNDSN
jgi:CRP-like cAMP-binding protein